MWLSLKTIPLRSDRKVGARRTCAYGHLDLIYKRRAGYSLLLAFVGECMETSSIVDLAGFLHTSQMAPTPVCRTRTTESLSGSRFGCEVGVWYLDLRCDDGWNPGGAVVSPRAKQQADLCDSVFDIC